MIPMDFDWLANVLATDYQGDNRKVININTDTRTLCDGEVFLALKGPNFDGHKFIEQAKQKGAIGVIVDHAVDTDIAQFVVADTRIALGTIGTAVMAQVAPKTIAITGSVGKTTVKEMCAAILSSKGDVLATKGNFNNDIGVPLTLLRLEPQHRFAVIELGANHIGEIAYTTAMTKPDVAVVCNVAAAHLEGFGSLQGVAQAKGEIYDGLKEDGIAIVNCDSDFSQYWLDKLATRNIKCFSSSEKLDIWAEDISLDAQARASFTLCTKQHSVPVKLALPGKHNISNALIAAALTSEFDVSLEDIASALATMGEVKGRVNLIEASDSLTIIDDTYNANVKSVKAAIDLLSDIQGHRILALGDMGELGEDARKYHQEVGEYALAQGIDELFTLGVLSKCASDVFGLPNRHFSNREQMLQQIQNSISKVDKKITLVVKGSRSSRMELLVTDLVNGQQQAINGVSSC
ncbi:MAG: UDP-N-acetylmuramoyl-tripeptide--D-alanyl-D-alanine ligase [Pseudoalteromonas tetraodonis]|jgi:UDP-N-acetylmuramoyl-tripeptide--D-alanyl-D-alanine ligase|uniref:UDP-N-acetylmuramoyl-tripeptide--D-alanyl-D-alanine ligase n=8 Tax=Gammaproteobacteria TaxID=1236 RepID=A0A9W4QXW9_PSEHA|nr:MULTISPECIES: UDP-N-acetylmuramoyl-tripeptide--D-alanyl-D-alanine ligase [Pseudoalteromonas]PHQ89501.1 MAG: UDP-N-acetylmuramoyl-tripeptide--D-alanyl-D-alanine ligase [Pseudoalteromonas sp.]ADT67450.1 D-alanine:D-alanine-adding enzyme [Pseudoalteromonas sp. SM9913]ALQ53843.1 UDP-N-acetylmuramoyl-tripeptide--D-alanyl-D-alanine ligase [Pseudoalteromonas issachenkonii]ATC89611.1 UDP-N-acetylmuramoyl-tripeptide--D-alanyl-D-alanine ligase [Pseudoalteromonas issachenkonii]ATD02100.1 UDP-N-acetylm|tara:strand:- start:1155 stop:2543 length:1389 start_codon:yes stop_codon:yes gene_type:complete